MLLLFLGTPYKVFRRRKNNISPISRHFSMFLLFLESCVHCGSYIVLILQQFRATVVLGWIQAY